MRRHAGAATQTTAGLLGPATADGLRQARRAGVGTAVTLLAIDLLYVPRRRIRPTYLLDAAMQAGWLTAWLRCGRLTGSASA
ncbi:hypothetical protein BIV23_02285 [Streptomyces monashensis]|uniref:Uncharacterized protein n=1 Tax=Streptomyces monashensis TaxID=1678012 RepID=A0A1S2QQB8_9ACTN|nr:hypothetical protein BIV23_02285 [Streptomyces monashensis]